MRKKIVIVQGDEYQAKIESASGDGALFSDVYKKARKIVEEIKANNTTQVESVERGSLYSYTHKNYNLKGSNIISFCADRGQGKTSAMCSFATQLKNEYENEFVLVDSIDPSALENGESIIRVLVSRLFYEFKKRYEEKEGELIEEDKKLKIIHLFSEIYTNIDYLKNGQKKAEMLDDLEYLSNLGSSTVLKNNLGELIDLLLPVLGEKNKARYLAVQIDDMDLATGDVMQICEDIRNYFSISNIIVLIAMNQAQMLRLICEKYMRQYEQLLHYEETAWKKCYEMATKYLEKLFPVGHKIVLPQMDNLIAKQRDDLMMLYIKSEKNLEEDSGDVFRDITEECKDIQEQLLCLVYHRTGMIFTKEEDILHPILPHTLRELTHFVKVLDDMDTVNFETLQTDAKEIEKLKKNLAEFKDYFINEWCVLHLKKMTYRDLLHNLEGQARNCNAVYDLVKEFCKTEKIEFTENRDGNVTYHTVQQMIHEKLENLPEVVQAIDILYTITLNDWFATAEETNDEYEKAIEFVELPRELRDGDESEYIIDSDGYEYEMDNFEVDRVTLDKYLNQGRLDAYAARQIELFCVPGTGETAENVICRTEQGYEINQELEELRFDMLHPFQMCANSVCMVTEEQNPEQVSSLNTPVMEETTKIRKEHIAAIRYVYANLDIQKKIRSELHLIHKELAEQKEEKVWGTFGLDVWGKIDEVLQIPYLKIDEKFREKYGLFSEQSMQTLAAVFLASTKNRKNYIGQYEKKVEELVSELSRKIVAAEIQRQRNNGEALELQLNMGEKISEENSLPEIIETKVSGVSKREKLGVLYKKEEDVRSLYKEAIDILNRTETKKEAYEKILEFKRRIAGFR